MNRPALVLLPGLLCDEAVWVEQRRALADRADTHVVDLEQRDSIRAMAEHVLATAPAATFALAGHSMGGRVALEVQRLAPQRVARLALLDTGYRPLPPGEAGDQERTKRLALLELAQREGMRTMGRQWARGMVHPRRVETPLFEAILDMIERRDAETFAAQIRALLGRPDAGPQLPSIRCPTLLLVGREDAWSALPQHEEMVAAIPGSALVVVDDCGHMSTMEQPEGVSRALAQWIDAGPQR
jgi:pimeloyl-ACP methyl ester carboxylesterase